MDYTTAALIMVGLRSPAGKEAVELVSHFTKEIFGPTAKALGQGIAAPIQAWADRRTERAKQTIIEGAVMVEKAGLEPHVVPGRVLLTILEHSSVEEDDGMHQRWVALLANAATGDVPPAFPRILSELSPSDARLLDSLPFQKTFEGLEDTDLDCIPVASLNMDILQGEGNLFFFNLVRLGLIETNFLPASSLFQETLEDAKLALTVFGRQFIKACSAPQARYAS